MSDPKADVAMIAEFLVMARPDGQFVLGAIPVTGGAPKVRTFGDPHEAARWAASKNAQKAHNLYWIHNRLRGPANSKPSEEDVEEVLFFHVDADPKQPQPNATADELVRWNAKERERIFAELRSFEPIPTFIVSSGGGYQAFWRLREPQFVGGARNGIDNFKAYNTELRNRFKADNCQSLEHLMRLPGTVNWPDEVKRKKGRVAARAEVVFRSDETYDVGEFTAAAPNAGKTPDSRTSVQLPDNIQLIVADDLPADFSEKLRNVIIHGDDPAKPGGYNSKSEGMWFATCEMVRLGKDDGFIAGVLLNPSLGISDHPLRQKRSLEYVARQIERARAENDHSLLRQMNEDHAVIEMYGGRCRVISWQASEVDHARLELVQQSFEDFRNRYLSTKVEVGRTKDGNSIYSTAGKWWLEHPMRRQYRSVIFQPGQDSCDGKELNIWRGLAVLPRQGAWPLLRRLIEEGLAAGDPTAADYILRWSAHAVQHPDVPAEVALALLGGKGTGKGTYGNVMRRIFGQHGIGVAGAKSLTSNFNKHLHDCCLLFADEAVAPGDRNAAGIIKSLITEPQIMIEPKGVDAFPARNHLKVIIASNDSWVVEATSDERRAAFRGF